MKFEFDAIKSEKNERERGLAFDKAALFDWDNAVYEVDDRFDYEETRYIASGFLGVRLHIVCFMLIEDGVRIISFRKANKREVMKYEKAINQQRR